LVIQFQCNDLDRAIPGHGLQTNRRLILFSDNRVNKSLEVWCWRVIHFYNAATGPQTVARRWRSVAKERDVNSMWVDTALRGHRPMWIL
jgi:hypothetical protein